MPILLAALSAVVYGVADYCGGRATRWHPAAVVTVVGQAVSLVLIVAAVFVMGTSLPAAGAWWWGGAAGAAGCIGLVALYFGLSQGTMTVVAPIAAVVGSVLPVVVGVWSGERPRALAYAGMVLAVVAVALVSGVLGATHGGPVPRVAVLAAVVAGSGFGLLFVLLDRTPGDSGLWPLVAARAVSVPLLLAVVVVGRRRPGAATGLLAYAVLAGALDMAANVLYLEAVRGGLLSLVAVVSSLYPASTVVLAYGLDKERFTRSQAVGLALAAAALVLITVGRD